MDLSNRINRITRALKALIGGEVPNLSVAAVSEMNRWLSDLSAFESPEIPDPRNPKALPELLTGIAARAITIKAQAVASRPLHLYRTEGGSGKVEIKDHPALERLYEPNWNMTLSDLLAYSVMWLEINGNAYWLYISDGDERDRGFWPLIPWQVRIIPKRNADGPWDLVEAYEFEGWGAPQRFAPDKIWHVKYPNPADPYLYGRPPLADCAAGLTVLDLMYKHNIYGLAAGGFPAVAAVLSATGDPQEVGALKKRMKDEMRQSFAGYQSSRSIAIFPPGTDIKTIGATAKDMDFYQGLQIMVEQVLAILGVPASKLGLVKDVNRANAEANDITFQGEVVQPLCEFLAQALTADWLWLVDPEAHEQGLYFEFEAADISDKEYNLRKTEMFLRQGVMVPNEVRAAEGMGERPDGGGDRPVFVEEAEARIGLAPGPAKGEHSHVVIKRPRISHGNQLLAYRMVWSRMVNLHAAKWRKHIREAFSGAETRAREYVNNYNVPDMALIMNFIFPHKDEQIAEMAKAGAKLVLVSRDAGRDLASRWISGDKGIDNLTNYGHLEQIAIMTPIIGKEWDEMDMRWATSRGERLAEILWAGVSRDIARLGITEDGEVGDLVAAVIATGERVESINSLAMARTESTREINGGLLDGYMESGVKYKQWNAVGDDETREDHLIADGQVVAVDEDFIVGGESAPYPGWEGLSPDQVVNCRCVALPYETAPI